MEEIYKVLLLHGVLWKLAFGDTQKCTEDHKSSTWISGFLVIVSGLLLPISLFCKTKIKKRDIHKFQNKIQLWKFLRNVN